MPAVKAGSSSHTEDGVVIHSDVVVREQIAEPYGRAGMGYAIGDRRLDAPKLATASPIRMNSRSTARRMGRRFA
jgi:hypothetical protein